MGEQEKRPSEESVLQRLALRGEDAVTRLVDELSKNPRVSEALARAMQAKGAVDETTRKTLSQVGLAAADEIRDLRGRLERLEQRLAKLEAASGGPARARSSRKSTTATKASGGTPPAASPSSGGSSSRPRGKRASGPES